MNKLFLITVLSLSFFYTSCSKDDIRNRDEKIVSQSKIDSRKETSTFNLRNTDVVLDHITVTSDRGDDVQNFTFDVTNHNWVGENIPVGGIIINGTVIDVEPNDDGGHNYYCIASGGTCYSNE